MLRCRAGAVAAVFLCCLLLRPTSGSADPVAVTITGGSADLARGQSPRVVDIFGTEGFSFSARIAAQAVSLGDLLPGETGRIFVDAVGLDLFGASATFRGVSYSDEFEGAFPAIGAELILRSASFLAPPLSSSNVSLQTPFTFRGSFFTLSEGAFTAQLRGRGVATIDLTPVPAGDNSFWFFRHARFDFVDAVAPTPEPASILLLGTAVAALAAAIRRRQ